MTASREKSLASNRPGNSSLRGQNVSCGEQQEVGGVANSFLPFPPPPLETREHVQMGRLEELVSPGNGLVSKSHFARSRAFVAIENLLEDLSGLSCLIDKSVRGYLCSSRRREKEREDWNFWRVVCGYSVARMGNINSTSVRSKSGFLFETVHGGWAIALDTTLPSFLEIVHALVTITPDLSGIPSPEQFFNGLFLLIFGF